MGQNIILEYVKKIQQATDAEDSYALEYVKEEGRRTYVTLEEVGVALDGVISDLVSMILDSQTLQEERLKAVIFNLDTESLQSIKHEFQKAEDDLLK